MRLGAGRGAGGALGLVAGMPAMHEFVALNIGYRNRFLLDIIGYTI
jgi:hypothetical protein